ncbi:hypothetical protein ACXR0O_18880 [Verrucomicrobiota bacterium sgz303538]
MTKHSIVKFCALAAGVILPSLSWAGTETAGKEVQTVVEKAKESCITGDIGINVVSQYISRGVIFENQGAILQPYADLYFKLYEGEGFLNKVQLNLGIWNSFQSRKTDAGVADDNGSARRHGSTTDSWYEFDFTAGISFTFAKYWTFTPSYYTFLSPNDGFATFQGLNLKLAFDDTEFLGAFALHPYVQVLFELENKAGTGPDEGVYYEVGIAPSFPIGPVTATIPITAGFGSDGFYGSLNQHTGQVDNEWFGYVSAGINLSYGLTFIPECFGKWSVSAGYTYYYLGDGTRDFNTPQRGGSVRSGEANQNEHVFSGGLVVNF